MLEAAGSNPVSRSIFSVSLQSFLQALFFCLPISLHRYEAVRVHAPAAAGTESAPEKPAPPAQGTRRRAERNALQAAGRRPAVRHAPSPVCSAPGFFRQTPGIPPFPQPSSGKDCGVEVRDDACVRAQKSRPRESSRLLKDRGDGTFCLTFFSEADRGRRWRSCSCPGRGR